MAEKTPSKYVLTPEELDAIKREERLDAITSLTVILAAAAMAVIIVAILLEVLPQ